MDLWRRDWVLKRARDMDEQVLKKLVLMSSPDCGFSETAASLRRPSHVLGCSVILGWELGWAVD